MDGMTLLPMVYRPKLEVLFQWLGSVMAVANVYEQHKVPDLYFVDEGLRIEDERAFPASAYADELIKGLGIEVKQNEEKHSVCNYDNVHVENHATLICEQEH